MTPGCLRDHNRLIVGDVEGPSVLWEDEYAEYSVSAEGDTMITYQWAIDPHDAAYIPNPNEASVIFYAGGGTEDIRAVLTVVVNSDRDGPVVRSREILIRQLPTPDILHVYDIEGPELIFSEIPVTYSVDAIGTVPLMYEWDVSPRDAGIFDSPNESSTVFTASADASEYEKDILIGVEIASEAGHMELRIINVTVLQSDETQGYISGGHPMEGINYHRNNRSTHLLPESLDGSEFIEPPYEYASQGDGEFFSLVVDADEKLYLGGLLSWEDQGITSGSGRTQHSLWSFYFEQDPGYFKRAGASSVITSSGLFSINYWFDWWRLSYAGQKQGEGEYSSSILHFNEWFELSEIIQEMWGWSYVYENTVFWTGLEDARNFSDILPLPGGRIITSLSKFEGGAYFPSETPAWFLQELDSKLAVISELQLAGSITGFAFDPYVPVIYVASDVGLYAFDRQFEELWNTTASVPDFSDGIPVIGDDGAILGCNNGTLSRIDPDGTPGLQQRCGAHIRPVILSDGTVAVILNSSILFFKSHLGLDKEIILPSGINSGDRYSRPPLVDAYDNMALFEGPNLYVIDRDGLLLDQRTFDSDIREIRLGPNHLFVALEYELYRFPR